MLCVKCIGKLIVVLYNCLCTDFVDYRSQTAYKNPDCIFTPNNVDALRYSIKLLQGSDDKFAVRSGGHSPLNQWANIDGGILISLRRFTELSYDPASKTVRVGSGNTWGQVYEFLKAYQRIIVGGRSPTVGFGLLVGGSYKPTRKW